jgi:predicted DNA binding protein
MTETQWEEEAMRLRSTRCFDVDHYPRVKGAKDAYIMGSECTTCTAKALKSAYHLGYYDGTRA